MNCINCGAFLTDTDLDYCPHCGANVLIQKKVVQVPDTKDKEQYTDDSHAGQCV